MKLTSIVGVLMVALSTGCDPATGVIRTVQFPKAPSNQAIEFALGDVPDAKGFKHETRKGADIWFTTNGVLTLELRKDKNGKGTLVLRHMKLGSGSTIGEMDRPRRLMDEVYGSLLRQFPELPPPASVTEKLIRVRTK